MSKRSSSGSKSGGTEKTLLVARALLAAFVEVADRVHEDALEHVADAYGETEPPHGWRAALLEATMKLGARRKGGTR